MANRNNADNQSHASICGMQWGDEGKGKTVDMITEQYDYIIRYNGGANAGHTVVVGDQKYALHLLPSGILHKNKINVIANGVVVDPVVLLDEIDKLRTRGISINNNLRISDRAHVVLNYHKIQDQLTEAAITAASDGKELGTTRRGIGPCYADKATRSTAVRVIDILDESRLRTRLAYIVKVKNAILSSLAKLSKQPFDPLNADDLTDEYLKYGQLLREHVCDSTKLLHDAIANGKSLLYEGANGCMLDVDHGSFPYVTSSHPGSLGVYAGSAVPGGILKRVIGIMKAYTTRVGAGPFPTEQDNATGDKIRKRGNEFGTTTGRPRRCGWLDLPVVKYATMINGVTELSLTLFDVLSGFDKLQICTSYEINGKTLDYFPADAITLENVQPVYKQINGFSQDISDCRNFNDLPKQAQEYVKLIESTVNVPIRFISVGPERSQTIYR